MKTYDTTTIPPGVIRRDYGQHYTLTGEKDALIASRLAKVEWFWPAKTLDKRGRVKRKKRTVVDGKKIVTWERANCPAFVEVFDIASLREMEKMIHEEVEALYAQRQADDLFAECSIELLEWLVDKAQEKIRKFRVEAVAPHAGSNVIPFPTKFGGPRYGEHNHDPSWPAPH